MIRNLCVLGLAMIFLCGCTVFKHPQKGAGDFERDRKKCEELLANNSGLSLTNSPEQDSSCVRCDEVKRCLEEQMGWERVRN